MLIRWFCMGILCFWMLWTWPATAAEVAPADLLRAQEGLTTVLNRLNADCARAADRLGQAGLTGKEARRTLGELCAAHPEAVDCAAVDPKGRMVAVEPAARRVHEGVDISSQDHIIRLQKTRKPVLSRLFKSAEGLDAVSMEYPVFSPKREFIGSVSVLIRPEALAKKGLGRGGEATVRVIQEEDGRILYSPDAREIGRTAPALPGTRLADRFFSQATSEKNACSSKAESCGEPEAPRVMVELHGTHWQLTPFAR